MFKYRIYYKCGLIEVIRANSPKEAWNIANNGVIAWIKWIK